MLRPRLIPCLLIYRQGLVKSVRFGDYKYIGDPLNAVRIFNEKRVDELIVVDIEASAKGHEPNYSLIRNLAKECRMPLCYGGGVGTTAQVERVVDLGVEKVAIGSGAISSPNLIAESAARVGRQSIVAVIDVKKVGLRHRDEVVTHNGKVRTGLPPIEFAKRLEAQGAGELLVNSVDRDGTAKGYDLNLIKRMRMSVDIPITAVGGAGSLQHISELYRECGVVGAGAGSLFVFKGKYRAVLISYPGAEVKDALQNGVKVHL